MASGQCSKVSDFAAFLMLDFRIRAAPPTAVRASYASQGLRGFLFPLLAELQYQLKFTGL